MVFFLILAFNMTACKKENSNETSKTDKTYVYYIDKNNTDLVPKPYTVKGESRDEQIQELLKQLTLNTEDISVTKAIPDSVELVGFELEDGVVSVSFGIGYGKMTKAQEVITRAAVVFTLTQLDYIDYVSFSVAGQPLARSSGEAVGNMQASDFVDGLDSNKDAYNKENFTIYFANAAGTKLLSYEFEGEYSSNMSKEQYIINKLLEGPAEESGYRRTISDSIEVVSIVTMDNICYLTLGENFLTEKTSVSDELAIYSIVNSLSELSYIHKVQISVNGRTDSTYHGSISLSEPFARNLDCVENPEESNIKK